MINKIHFIWWQGWNKLPQKYEKNIKSWQKNNPNHKIYYWDKEKIINLFHKHSLKIDLLEDFKLMIQKIDFSKYIILYFYGGYYIDVDIKCNNLLDKFLKKDKFTLCKIKLFNNINCNLLNNGFFYCPCKSKIMENIIFTCIKNNKYFLLKNFILEFQTMFITGPIMLTYKLFYEDVNILDSNTIYECNLEEYNNCENKGLLGTHLHQLSWMSNNFIRIIKLFIFFKNNIKYFILIIIIYYNIS